MELLINTVDGWIDTTRLYRGSEWQRDDTGVETCEGWIIQNPDQAAIREIITRSRKAIEEMGLPAPEQTEPPAGPVTVFRASIQALPVMSWISERPGEEPPQVGGLTVEQTDTECVFFVDGQRWGGMRLEQTGRRYQVIPIDADGDPLNGLTPLYTLPSGTTFEQALEHITTATESES